MSDLPKTYKAARAHAGGAPLVIDELPMAQPGPGQILVKVIACGVCHSDMAIVGGFFGNIFPRAAGHELVGDVVAVGEGVTRFTKGDRVGGPFHGGHDGTCKHCIRGESMLCDNPYVNGVHFDGGFAEYTVLRSEAAVRVPKNIDPYEAAPLLCAGVTVFNGIRKQKIEHGRLIAVQGLGGLGHLAVQYAAKMGYKVVAISSGSAKRDFAFQLGAIDYIDTSKENAVERLNALGGAAMVVATAPNGKVFAPLLDGIEKGGKLLLLAPVGPVEFDTLAITLKGRSVVGHLTGTPLDCEESISFAQEHGIKCMIEKFPLSEVNKALEVCGDGSVRFRAVLAM